jgi:hypothetical protein
LEIEKRKFDVGGNDKLLDSFFNSSSLAMVKKWGEYAAERLLPVLM